MDENTVFEISEISEEEKESIEDQLGIILKSTYFNSAKQMQCFLEYVVNKTLAGQGNLLKQYTIGIEALNFPNDFDSDSNPLVRIMGGRVRNRLEEFYKNTNNNRIIITIPKGTYVPNFNRNLESSNDYDAALSVKKGKLDTSTGPKIALVSFSDKTQSNVSNRLIVGITDILAKELSNFIFSRFNVYNPYADKNESYKSRQEIKVDYKLNLYIHDLSDKKHELICRLTNSNEEVIWSESYEIDSKISLDKQDGIIEKIITMLIDTHQSKLNNDWTRKLLLNKENIPNEFQTVAYFRQYYDNLNIETFIEAVKATELALDRNPNDIISNLLMSSLCRRDYAHGYNLIDSPLEKGLEYAEIAVHLRYDSHEAHFILGQILFFLGEWDRSLEELQNARKITHFNASMEYGCGLYFCLMDRWDEGIPLVKRSMSMSKHYPSWYHMILSIDFYRNKNYQEALTEAKKILAPSFAHGPIARCIAYAQLGDIKRAKNELKIVINRRPDFEKNGKQILERYFFDETLTDKIWKGFELALK